MSEKREYNTAGIEAATYYVADEDPCGYVEENPNPVLGAINKAVGEAIQRVTEVRENEPELFVLAARKCNLAREMAVVAARCSTPEMNLWRLRIRRVVDSI